MVMSDLHAAIVDALSAQGVDVREIGAKDLLDGTISLTRPAINITINSATYTKVTLYTYKCKCVISLILVINRLKGGPSGEAQRKSAVYQLIESVSSFLTLQRLVPELENPLIPQGFRNITTPTFAKAGYQLYQLDFWASWPVEIDHSDGPDLGMLQKIIANYWVVPGHDPSTDPVDAQDDLVTV